MEAYEGSNNKPIFEPSDNFFILKLPNLKYVDPVNDSVNDSVNDAVNDTFINALDNAYNDMAPEAVVDSVNDAVNDAVNDSVNYVLNDFDLAILNIIKKKPGLNALKIFKLISKEYKEVTINMVRNTIRRKLSKYCRFEGSFKNGGYVIFGKKE